jgi:hypothetical protein
VNIVTQLLDDDEFHRRTMRKMLPLGVAPRRNDQFEYIAELRTQYAAAGWPISSIDTKQRELLGMYYRDGFVYSLAERLVYDHDFARKVAGIRQMLIPHALYDLQRNVGHLYLGLSHDTSEFACDNLYAYWMRFGRWYYHDAPSWLLLCDCGGSNSYRTNYFKECLQRVADRIGIEIRVAHYPPYTSKYNPIEHRLFPHVTRACAGTSLSDLQMAAKLMRKTRTSTGLRVTVEVNRRYYATGQTCTAEFLDTLPIEFDAALPAWNYRAVPGRQSAA